MPHVGWLVVGVGIAAGLYAGYEWLVGASGRTAVGAANARARKWRAPKGAARPKDLGRLVWDEAMGVYRPALGG